MILFGGLKMKYKAKKLIKKSILNEADKKRMIAVITSFILLIAFIVPSSGSLMLSLALIVLFILFVGIILMVIMYFSVNIYKIRKTQFLPLSEEELDNLEIHDIYTYCDFLNKYYHTKSILKHFYSDFSIEIPSEFKHGEIIYDELSGCFEIKNTANINESMD